MQFDIYTLFPEVFSPYLQASILDKAITRGLLSVNLHNIRDYALDKHKMTDDEPYGGGGGMVMKPEPIFGAIEATIGTPTPCPVILMTPQGERFNQHIAVELAQEPHLAMICGRYEGVDERVRKHLVTREISVGDFVLTGGELPALMMIDAISRQLPGVLGDPEGALKDSHAGGLLEHPHYTRPYDFRGWTVPEILRSGDHGKIERWRREQSLRRTLERRPDMLESVELNRADQKFINELREKQDD